MKQVFAEPLGQTSTVKDTTGRVQMHTDERSRCMVHGGRHPSVVNGVCLRCQRSKHRHTTRSAKK